MTRKKLASATPATPIAAELSALPATDTPHSISFPIAGIGASAGGLAAFEAFFPGMPIDKDPDMAFLNGMLQLLEPAAPRGQRLPIDRLCYPCLHERKGTRSLSLPFSRYEDDLKKVFMLWSAPASRSG